MVKLSQDRLSLILIGVGSALMVAAITVLALVATGVIDDGGGGNSDLETITTFGDPITLPTEGPAPTPEAEFPPASDAPLERLVIPDANVDAPVVIKGLDAANVMESPDNAYDTAWYDFSARPGKGGNAVFSGHVDYINVGRAVFWGLKDLKPGSLVEVRLADGTSVKYAVNSVQVYEAETAPVDLIVGPTPRDTVTLITCAGTFNSATRQYDKRLVVRAERVSDAPTLPPPA